MAKVTMVPISINAPSEKELTFKMLQTNTLFGKQMLYFDIQFVNNQWTAWYFNDILEEGAHGRPQ
jgi:hypothetical protein